jgi:hypothetical protein
MAMTFTGPVILIFLCGFGGSIAVEIVRLYRCSQNEPFIIPQKYSDVAFWAIQLLLAMVAGGLAVAYEIHKPLLAINIGAATPLLISTFAEGLRSGFPPR